MTVPKYAPKYASPEPISPTAETMQAVTVRDYGPTENLVDSQIVRPRIERPEQVLIEVHAAAVNPIDWKIRRGLLRWLLPARFPLVLGYDVCGELVDVGSQAASDGWRIGDKVIAFLDNRHGGGYAQYARANFHVIAHKPTCLSDEEAAAIPLAGSTAWQSLHSIGGIQPGSHVLITGASGGVGSFAVQIARAADAEVVGVCSTDHVKYVRLAGARLVIDYTQQDFLQADSGPFDIVFDAAAVSSYWACRKLLTRRGVYVTTLPSFGTFVFQMLTKLSRRRCQMVLVRPDGAVLRELAQLAEEKQLHPAIDQVYPLSQAPAAHAYSETGHVRGKLVLRVDE